MLRNKYAICLTIAMGLGLAGCGEGEEADRPELKVLGGKADVPSWLLHIPAEWGCDQTLGGKFTGWDSAHLYSFPGKIGYAYTFDFVATYPGYKGAAIAVYDSETGQRVAYRRNRWSNKAQVVYEAEKSIKYLVAVYSVSVYARGSYTLGAACEVLDVTCQSDAACGADEFCKFVTGCGATDAGTCTAKPDAWIELWAPVCGCDGKTYGNEAEADGNGVSVSYVGECKPQAQGVTVTTDAKGYTTQQQITATVSNATQQSIFLGGCSALSWQQQVNGAWVDQGPDHVCFWEGFAVEVNAGDAHTETLPPRGEGTYRLAAGYGVGCTPGQPLSQASCAAHHVAYGAAFKVKDCPMLSLPNPASFCPDGKMTPRYDADGICVSGYDCEPCEAFDCGPALGMPSYLCDDGVSMGGPTGKCLGNGWGGCAWEVLGCP